MRCERSSCCGDCFALPHAPNDTGNGTGSVGDGRRAMPPNLGPVPGWTVRDVAARYRVGCSKVRAWIARGELVAINTGPPCGRPRWVVTVDALEAFEQRRAGRRPQKPARRPKRVRAVDFYPD